MFRLEEEKRRQFIGDTTRLRSVESGPGARGAFSKERTSADLEDGTTARAECLAQGLTDPGRPPSSQRTHERPSDERYVSSGELHSRYSISGMTLWRWMQDPEVAFPRPVKLNRNGRNFWWLPAIIEWERTRVGNSSRAEPVRT